MDDNSMQPDDSIADNTASDDNAGGLLGKLKSTIPGDLDDKIIDSAVQAADKVGDAAAVAATSAGSAVAEATDKVKDTIPGEMDDKIIDAAGNAIDKAGGVASDAVDKVKGINPFDSK